MAFAGYFFASRRRELQPLPGKACRERVCGHFVVSPDLAGSQRRFDGGGWVL
jgi:hypothetical protein